MGTIVETKADFYSSRIPKKNRKTSLVDELLADAEFRRYVSVVPAISFIYFRVFQFFKEYVIFTNILVPIPRTRNSPNVHCLLQLLLISRRAH